MSITRILKLAELHGPFVRFFPEGDELDGAITDAENADLKDNKEFDKVLQQSQQHEGNAKRATAAAEAANSQLGEANTQLEDLKSQLAVANAKAEASGVDVELNEADYSDTDVQLVKKIKALDARLAAGQAEITAIRSEGAKAKAKEAATEAKAGQEAAYQDILNDMDVDYGPEHRNAAVKAFDALVQDGKVIGGPAKATRILEKCYKDAVKAVVAKDAKNKKDGVRLDSGSGGGVGESFSGVELTAGSLEDVAAQAGKSLNKPG